MASKGSKSYLWYELPFRKKPNKKDKEEAKDAGDKDKVIVKEV